MTQEEALLSAHDSSAHDSRYGVISFVDEGVSKSTFLCPILKKVWSRGYLLLPLSCL